MNAGDHLLLSLDFANTASFGRHPDPFASVGGVIDWLEGVGLTEAGPAQRSPSFVRLLSAEAFALREGIRQLLFRYSGRVKPSPAELHVLNRVLERSPRVATLHWSDSAIELVQAPADASSAAVLAPLALGAAHVVTTVDPARLRACDARDCRRWFVDTSKGGRRRWCSMALCGNRAKAARHRRNVRSPS